MKIVKAPTIICSRCKCQFKIDAGDVSFNLRDKSQKSDIGQYIECPICKSRIYMPFCEKDLL